MKFSSKLLPIEKLGKTNKFLNPFSKLHNFFSAFFSLSILKNLGADTTRRRPSWASRYSKALFAWTFLHTDRGIAVTFPTYASSLWTRSPRYVVASRSMERGKLRIIIMKIILLLPTYKMLFATLVISVLQFTDFLMQRLFHFFLIASLCPPVNTADWYLFRHHSRACFNDETPGGHESC